MTKIKGLLLFGMVIIILSSINVLAVCNETMFDTCSTTSTDYLYYDDCARDVAPDSWGNMVEPAAQAYTVSGGTEYVNNGWCLVDKSGTDGIAEILNANAFPTSTRMSCVVTVSETTGSAGGRFIFGNDAYGSRAIYWALDHNGNFQYDVAGGYVDTGIAIGPNADVFILYQEFDNSRNKLNASIFNAAGELWSADEINMPNDHIGAVEYNAAGAGGIVNVTNMSCWTGSILERPAAVGPPANFSITAKDIESVAINNFTAYIDGTTYTTTTGIITTSLYVNDTTLYNLILGGGNFFNQTHTNLNVTTNLAATGLYEAELIIYAKQKITEETINNFTAFTFLGNNGTGNGSLKLTVMQKSYSFVLGSPSYINTTLDIDVSSKQNTTTALFYSVVLNATVIDYKGNLISNFSLTLSNGSYLETLTATNSSYINIGLLNGTYRAELSVTGYENKIVNITINTTLLNYQFFVYTANSLNITIRSEETGAIITGTNISIRFLTETDEWVNITNFGAFYIDELTPGQHNIKFTDPSGTYSERSYQITISNYSHHSLTSYLATNVSVTLFTVTDRDTSASIENVLGTMYRFISGAWVPVEAKYSDITGKIQFSYITGQRYKFFFSKEDYDDYIFYLDPILYASYDISLTRSDTEISEDSRIALRYFPQEFINNEWNNFSFLIQNPTGDLITYGFTLTYPGGDNRTTGSNAIGGQLNLNFNISGAVASDTVRLVYFYETAEGNTTRTYYLPIAVLGTTPKIKQDQTYGLGIFERILIATILVLLVVGITTLVGRPVEGGALGLFIFGYLAYNGFVPWWAILPSMLIGVAFIGLTGGR